ncbi:hypothetical protein [Ehrlichia muris]|uniref:Uncharacterized protein n=1 Tax=Ehrlichia muris AS145 TaxID=1423892 RepID=V9R8Q4_9RICK|nr:hypothetical protein [Ehrlichia muris]AHC39678.1 hypothetical protein EMUR_01185 [Ehrlichia muris AS145]
MLTQLRNSWQKLSIPSFVKLLGSSNVSHFRDIKYDKSISGEQTWKDLRRNTVKVNGNYAKFFQVIDAHTTNNGTPRDNEYRKILYKILGAKFYEHSNIKISEDLVDECVTILNQNCLFGAFIEIPTCLGEDIKDRMHANHDIVPSIETSEAEIKIISESNLAITHRESLFLRNSNDGSSISRVNTLLSFNISSNDDGTVTYSNSKISLEIPQDLALNILRICPLRMANMFVPIKNAIRKISSFCTGTLFQKVAPYNIIHGPDTLTIGCSLPDYKCSPVAMTSKTENPQKNYQQSQYQTRSTFTPPQHLSENTRKPTGNSNKDPQQHVKEIRKPKVQPQKNPKTESRSL